MLENEVRALAALSSTYDRGLDLVRKGHVVAMEVDYPFEGFVDVSGTVMGSTGERYDASIAIFADDGTITDCDCSCPAHTSYSGMCKHTVALALKYLSSIGEMRIVEAGTTPVGKSKAPAGKMYEYASPQVERLVAAYAARVQRTARAAAESTAITRENVLALLGAAE